ncbi:MAG: isochorismate synthase, partial [Dehalococcoidia bacterium]|nr:isochorismate synthase [Dehalococcoidia bacterium]
QLQELVSTAPAIEAQPVIVQTDLIPSQDAWLGWVSRALDSIRRGDLDKVVLARRKTLRGQSAFSVEMALHRLRDVYPECTIFAVDSSDSAFIGATPERLARVEAGTLSLDCLAGSAPRGSGPYEDRVLEERLLQSPKERFEHAFVVKMAAGALNEICSDVHHNQVPEVLKLKTIQHLRTPFNGRLQPGRDILDAVEQLHPTPAVGGVPTGRAVRLIRELEGDRGWYSSPVGWVDPDGEGEFAVAIRSALVRDNTATLFAGSGIVEGSDPREEFAETEVKFKPLIAALTEVQ